MSAITVDTAPRPARAAPQPGGRDRASRSARCCCATPYVLRKTLKEFIPRTLLQPFLLVFVFTYVFPKIGQGVGGSGAGEAEFSTILVAGVVGARDHVPGHPDRRAADGAGVRVHARDRGPRARAAAGRARRDPEGGVGRAREPALRAARVPDRRGRAGHPGAPRRSTGRCCSRSRRSRCYMCGALGLTFGTLFDPRTVPLLFGIIVIPITFLGCIYYPWQSLEPIRWLQILVLANPLVYMSEGFRAALTDSPHMSLWVVYPVLVGFSVLFTWQGINGFKRRVVS